jgi:multidrug efflux system membrane fusion protein
MQRKFFLPILVLAVGAGAVAWFATREPTSASAPTPPAAVPVAVAAAQQQDVDIVQTGLGTVQAFNTVTVRPQVNGQIVRIAFDEGQDVKAGDLLAVIDPRPYEAALAQAQAQLAKDQAQLTAAKLDLQRYQSLAQRNFGTKQSVDTQQSTVGQLTAALAGDQAAIDTANINLGFTQIKAPIGGRTGMRQIDVGNVVHTTDNGGIVVITQIQPITVLFTLPESFLPEINKQQALAPLRVEAWREDGSVKLAEGKLTLIDNQIDQNTGTIRLKATFENAERQLWPGQFVEAHLRLRVEHNGITVPAQAIQRGPNGTVMWVVKADDTVELRPVKIGQTLNDVALVESGLQAGERVVTDGQYRLRRGAKITVAGPNKPDGGKPGPASTGAAGKAPAAKAGPPAATD